MGWSTETEDIEIKSSDASGAAAGAKAALKVQGVDRSGRDLSGRAWTLRLVPLPWSEDALARSIKGRFEGAAPSAGVGAFDLSFEVDLPAGSQGAYQVAIGWEDAGDDGGNFGLLAVDAQTGDGAFVVS